MLTRELLSMLWCPTCQANGLQLEDASQSLPIEHGAVRCSGCDASYAVRHGVPILMPEGTMTGPDWELWEAHLEKLQARREARIENPSDTVTRLALRTSHHPHFARFTGIREGRVLDVGCGPGKFRHNLDLARVQYVGLDPLALPEVSEFPFAQGLAERIPFKDGTFTDIVVLAALDHFRDPEGFFVDARRVLAPGGRLHIMQSVHQLRGPISAIKVMGHKIKDALEERRAVAHGTEVPKHLAEYTTRSLLQIVCEAFDVESINEHAAAWYSPTKLFLTFTPKIEVAARSA